MSNTTSAGKRSIVVCYEEYAALKEIEDYIDAEKAGIKANELIQQQTIGHLKVEISELKAKLNAEKRSRREAELTLSEYKFKSMMNNNHV